MAIIATGIDLAKNIFAVNGVNVRGTVSLRQPKVARAKPGAMITALPPGVIGMEACSGAQDWVRQCQAQGHTFKLPPPKRTPALIVRRPWNSVRLPRNASPRFEGPAQPPAHDRIACAS